MAFSFGIDAFRLVTAPRTSHATYISELAKGLCALEEIERVCLFVPRPPVDDSVCEDLMTLKNVEFVWPDDPCYPERRFSTQIYWIHYVIPRLVREKAQFIKYYVAPYHHPPVCLGGDIKIITVIHDVCGLRSNAGYSKTKKSFYQHLLMFMLAGLKSDALVPISNYTREQFATSFPFFARRLSGVVYNCVKGETVETVTAEKILFKFGLTGAKFFLAFGLPGVRKSWDLISDAFSRYKRRGGTAGLVLIVPESHRSTITDDLLRSEILESVFVVSDLDSTDRDALYRGALALLFPSRCEGFGYPIVESMRQGCPPIAWDQGPAPELVGHKVKLLNNLEPGEIVKQMSYYDSLDGETREKLRKRLISQSLLFDRRDFGRQFLGAMTGSN